MNWINGFIVFVLGIVILWEGRDLPLGRIGAPGPRFYPLVLAVLLIILSPFLIFDKGRVKGVGEAFPSLSPILRQQLPVFLSLLAYFFFLEYLGFVVASLMVMAFLYGVVGNMRWYVAILAAFVSVGLAYFCFVVLLKVFFPRGVLGI